MQRPRLVEGLELRLLGIPQVVLHNQEVRLQKKTLALLAYVAVEGASSRSRLAGLLWDLDEGSARRNLRRELHRLREAGLEAFLAGDAEHIELSGFGSDVAGFEQALEAGQHGLALELYRGPLLQDLELEAEGFVVWLEHQRERLAQQWRRAMLYQAEALETRGDWPRALEIHLKLLAEDNLQERHQREVMRLHYLLGERESALERFEQFRGTLKQELGLEPLPETLQLVDQIRRAQGLKPSAPVQTLNPPLPLHTPLVGREEIWAKMEAAWAARQLVVVRGEPGVGKTRLVREFALSRGTFQMIRGRPTDLGVPFATLGRWVREVLREIPAVQLPLWVQHELARLVPELSDTPLPPLRSKEERLRLYEAFVEFIEQAIHNKMALLWDDLQFFDTASLEMGLYTLQRLREHGSRGPLLVAFRRGELQPEAEGLLGQLLDSSGGLLIELEALQEPQLLELVRRMSGSAEGQLFSHRLYRVTAGNPFFVLETLKTLFESGLLRVNAQGGWETPFDEATTDYHELPIPKSVREAVLRRVENLGQATRRFLEAASLAGDGFGLETLSGATALTEWEGLEALERALEARILEVFSGGYRFSHDLFTQAIQDSLSSERKRLLHQKLALSLEYLQAPPARIAEHLEQAGKPKQAMAWRIKAAQVAEKVYAYAEALQHYQIALQAGPELNDLLSIRRARFELLIWGHDEARIDPEIEALQKLSALLSNAALEAEALVWQSRKLARFERHQEAFAQAHKALAHPGIGHAPPVNRFFALQIVAAGYRDQRQVSLAEQTLLQALEVAQGLGPDLRGRSHDDLANLLIMAGSIASAKEHNHQAIRIFAAAHLQHDLPRAYNTRARIAWAEQDLHACVAHLKQGYVLAEETGQTIFQFATLNNLVKVLVDSGDLSGASEWLAKGLQTFERLHDPASQGNLQQRLAEVERLRGRLGLAIQALQEAIKLRLEAGSIEPAEFSLHYLAELYLMLGDPVLARATLDQLGSQHTPSERTEFDLAWCESFETPLLALGRLERASGISDARAGAHFGYLRARILLEQKQPESCLQVIESVKPVAGLDESLIVALKLQAQTHLGKPDPALVLQARQSLNEQMVPPLESVEVYRALTEAYQAMGQTQQAKTIWHEAQQKVQDLATSLAAFPELQKSFLRKHQA